MTLIAPYTSPLVNLLEEGLAQYAATLPSIQISPRSQCDLELLATGAFTPLDRFMSQRDYERVVGEMRLANGVLFPIPITLPVHEPPPLHHHVALHNHNDDTLAVMEAVAVYRWDPEEPVAKVRG